MSCSEQPTMTVGAERAPDRVGILWLARLALSRLSVDILNPGGDRPMTHEESDSQLAVASQEGQQSVRSLLGQVAKIAGKTQDTAKAGGGNLVKAIKGGATTTAQHTANLAQQAGELAQGAGDNLKSGVGAVTQRVSPVAATVKSTVTGAASTVTGAASTVVSQTGQLAQSASSAVGNTVVSATEGTTQRLGQTVRYINDNPLLRRAAGLVPSHWLLSIANQVDVEKAAEEVERLRAAHPEESQEQLAHRLMVQKTLLASGMGLASSLVPGSATALFALDLAATVMLQVEMIYQIAMIYDLDLSDPQREGEMLAIFGLAMGGQKAAQVGTTYLTRAGISSMFQNIPVAGALIGASSNAALNYAIGYSACRFYRTQADGQEPTALESEAALETAEQAGEQYLTDVLEQQRIMDQVLAHAIVMAYPEQQWDNIPQTLESLALPPESREAIAQHLESPEPLEQLLQKLTPDFALPLVAQCQRLAQTDGDVTADEQQLLDGLKAQLA